MTSHEIRLSFLTDLNHGAVIRIPHANELLTNQQVSDAMNGIITTGVVQTSRGTIRRVAGAELVSTENTEFNII